MARLDRFVPLACSAAVSAGGAAFAGWAVLLFGRLGQPSPPIEARASAPVAAGCFGFFVGGFLTRTTASSEGPAGGVGAVLGLDFGLSDVSVFGCAGGGPVARGLGAGAAGALAAGLLAGGGSAGAGAGGLGAGAVYLGVASISRGLRIRGFACCACSCACCSCSACHCSACICCACCSCCACQCACHCCCCHCCCCAGYPPSREADAASGLATPPPPGNLCLSQRKKNKTGRSFIYYEYAAERSLAATFNAFRCSSIMKMQPNEAWL